MCVPLLWRTDNNPISKLLSSKQVYIFSRHTKLKLELCDERNTWDWLRPAHVPINSEFDRPVPLYSGGKHTRWINPRMEIIILLFVSTIWTNNFILPEGW